MPLSVGITRELKFTRSSTSMLDTLQCNYMGSVPEVGSQLRSLVNLIYTARRTEEVKANVSYGEPGSNLSPNQLLQIVCPWVMNSRKPKKRKISNAR